MWKNFGGLKNVWWTAAPSREITISNSKKILKNIRWFISFFCGFERTENFFNFCLILPDLYFNIKYIDFFFVLVVSAFANFFSFMLILLLIFIILGFLEELSIFLLNQKNLRNNNYENFSKRWFFASLTLFWLKKLNYIQKWQNLTQLY